MLRVVVRGETYFACEICGLIYETAELASSCESWCRAHGSCNVEIASHAVGSIRRAGLRISGPRP